VASFSDRVCNDPVLLSKLDRVQSQSQQFAMTSHVLSNRPRLKRRSACGVLLNFLLLTIGPSSALRQQWPQETRKRSFCKINFLVTVLFSNIWKVHFHLFHL